MTVVLLLLLSIASPVLGQERPVIQPGDTINLTVDDQVSLTRRFLVAPNGTITLDLVGVIQAQGLTSEQLEADLRKRLVTFLRNPRVRVQVEPAQRVFVFGGVPKPGAVDLTEKMTLLEALGQSGYSGTSEVIVARPMKANGPTPIDAPDAQVIRVNLRELEKEVESGRLERNLVLRDGDSIYVPTDDPNRIYVSGKVKTPGWFSIPEGTTVIQAITLAGGVSEDGALHRVRISRMVDAEMQSLKVSNDDTVRPGDTLIVPEKFSLAIDLGLPPPDAANLPGRIHLSPAFWIRPVASIKRFGVDNNVFNDANASSDLTIVGGPRLETALDLPRFDLNAVANLDFVYFQRFSSERSVNSDAKASIVVAPAPRVQFVAGASTTNTRERLDSFFDDRVRRFEHVFDGGVRFQPLRRLTTGFSVRDFDRIIGNGVEGPVLGRDTLTEHVNSMTATVTYAVTSLTDLSLTANAATHRFALAPRKNSDATEFSIGAVVKSDAVVSGDIRGGYLKNVGLDEANPDLETLVGSTNIYWKIGERTRLGLTAERSPGNAFQPEASFSVVDRGGPSIRHLLSQRFDIQFDAYLEKHRLKKFANPFSFPNLPVRPPDSTETNRRFSGEFGFRMRAVRVGAGVTYIQRFNLILDSRTYTVIRGMMNVSYGVFQARAL